MDVGARLGVGELIQPEAVASLQWGDETMEILRFHDAFRGEVQGLASAGAQWGVTSRRVSVLFEQMDARRVQQQTRALLEFLASRNRGFNGSLFLVEATTVLDQMLDSWFPPLGPGTPATPQKAIPAR